MLTGNLRNWSTDCANFSVLRNRETNQLPNAVAGVDHFCGQVTAKLPCDACVESFEEASAPASSVRDLRFVRPTQERDNEVLGQMHLFRRLVRNTGASASGMELGATDATRSSFTVSISARSVVNGLTDANALAIAPASATLFSGSPARRPAGRFAPVSSASTVNWSFQSVWYTKSF